MTLRRRSEVYTDLGVTPAQRFISIGKDETLIELFAGTVISNTLMWMLRAMGMQVATNGLGHLKLVGRVDGIVHLLVSITKKHWNSHELMDVTFFYELYRTKFSFYLSEKLQKEMHLSGMVDVEGTIAVLKDKKFVVFRC